MKYILVFLDVIAVIALFTVVLVEWLFRRELRKYSPMMRAAVTAKADHTNAIVWTVLALAWLLVRWLA